MKKNSDDDDDDGKPKDKLDRLEVTQLNVRSPSTSFSSSSQIDQI